MRILANKKERKTTQHLHTHTDTQLYLCFYRNRQSVNEIILMNFLWYVQLWIITKIKQKSKPNECNSSSINKIDHVDGINKMNA